MSDIGGIAGLASTIAGSGAQQAAAHEAAQAQIQSTQMAIDAQKQARDEARGYLQPYVDFGSNALSQFGSRLGELTAGVPVPGAMTQAQLEATPGYQFNLSQGMRAAQNSAAAKGLGLSGAGVKAATRFATGLADNTYQQQFANQQTLWGNQVTNATNSFNRLLAATGLGQSSAAGQATGAMQTGSNIAGLQSSLGNALGASAIASGNAMAGGLNNLGQYFQLQSMTGNSNPFSNLFGGSGSMQGGGFGGTGDGGLWT